MRAPSLLAWLSGLAPYRIIHALEEKNEGLYQEVRSKDAFYPPPPACEVLPSDVVKSKSFVADTIRFEGGLTLLKGRTNFADAIHVENAAGKFEGSLKLSKCAVELVNTLRREIQDGQLSFRGKRVLELGCGHGLPGIFACLKGASVVHFQDLNVEVLRSVTIPNVTANLDLARFRHAHLSDAGQATVKTSQQLKPELHYYAGDWTDMDSFLSLVRENEADLACDNDYSGHLHSRVLEANLVRDSTRQVDSDQSLHRSSHSMTKTKKLLSAGSRACERGNVLGGLEGGYDIILMSETIYALLSLPKLYNLIMKCLRPRYGVVYLASKKHYYGLGGGTRQFKCIADDDGVLGAHLVADFTDSSFNPREIWKFFHR